MQSEQNQENSLYQDNTTVKTDNLERLRDSDQSTH